MTARATLMAIAVDLANRANEADRKAAKRGRKHAMIRIRSDKARTLAVALRALLRDTAP